MPNINSFISSFNNTEFSRAANFDVVIAFPQALTNKLNFITAVPRLNDMVFRCEASELPAKTFSLIEQKTYGPVRFFPVQNAFDRINLRFICSDDMFEKIVFDEWMSVISMSPYNNDAADYNFDFEYRDNYQTTIKIQQKDVTGKIAYEVRLFEAYPVTMQPVNLSWDSVNTVNKIDVVFSYRFWKNFKLD